MFAINNASFKRKNTQILNNINLALQEGEVLSILGCNGAGKTTLLKCMVGLLEWNLGESVLLGKSLKAYNQQELWKIISYVPQAKTQIFNIKVLDMVALGCNPSVRFKPNMTHFRQAHDILDKLHLTHLKHKLCLNLSGGELQMVLFARALVKNPKILILDEPESNLDFHNQKTILDMLKRLSDNGCTIILNTHFPSHARFLSHKVVLLHKMTDCMDCLDSPQGTNAIFGQAKHLLTSKHLSRLYNVPLHTESMPMENEYVFRI